MSRVSWRSATNAMRAPSGDHVGHISGKSPSVICFGGPPATGTTKMCGRSEEHTSELQSQSNLVCRLLLEKKKNTEESATETTSGGTTVSSSTAGKATAA